MTQLDTTPSLDQLLFDKAPVGLAFLDRDLRYLRLNEQLAVINGIPVEAHLGRTVQELWPHLDTALAALRRVLATGEAIEGLELQAETPAAPGVVRTFMQSYQPVHDQAGAIIGLNVSVVDITAQKAAEVAARRAQAAATLLARLNGRLASTTAVEDAARFVVESTGEAFGADKAGLLLVVGGELAWAAVWGYPSDIDDDAFLPIPPSEPSPSWEAMRSARIVQLEDLEAVRADYPDVAASMERRTGDQALAISPLIVDGEPIGALYVGFDAPRRLHEDDLTNLRAVADVAAQTIARIGLVSEERRLRQTLVASVEQMPLGVIVVDPRGRIVHSNAASRRIWQGAAAAAEPVREAVNDSRYSGWRRDGSRIGPSDWPSVRSARTGEVVVDEEITIQTFDGSRRVITASSAPIEDDDRRRIGAVVVFSDITDRRRAADLREAFIGMLSHELRTPVTSIYGTSHLLRARGDELDATVRRELRADVANAADHLMRLVENLLVLSRAEHGATSVDLAPVLLPHLVRRILAQHEHVWPGTRFLVRMPVEAVPVPPALADEAMVTLMLVNILGNADKYAPGQVDVSIQLVDEMVRVLVRDAGPGIPADELDTIFELYHRSASTARRAPGSGIGLFVVRHLAEAQGGRAWAANRPEGGAEVGFELPIAPGDEDE